jgi:opacity protein-like surface antigen
MKKIFLALAMFALFASSAFAQNVNFGVNISYQSEGMVGDKDAVELFSDEQVSSAFALGLNVRVPFNQMISLRSGLDFQINAYSYTYDDYGKDYDYMNLFLNLQLPVLARINFTPGFFAEAGLDMQFNLLAQYYSEAADDLDMDAWDDIENWRVFQLGPTVGAGYTLWFGLEFSGRFSYGVLDSFTKGDIDMSPLRFQIDIAYWFGYKK